MARWPFFAVRPSTSALPQQLDSVIVSASRRREPAREVPLQINILPAAQLEREGAKSLGDFLTKEGGVDIRSSGGAGLGAISIRGVSTGFQTSATVGSYVDDVAVGSSSAYAQGSLLFLDLSLLDLNHIEVLRGPQGTLYGAAAVGGLLKYVTNQPNTYDFSGKVTVSGSSIKNGSDSGTVGAVVNVPLKEDVAAVRVSAYREHQGGWVQGVGLAGGNGINAGDSTGLRASFLLTPDRDLTFRLTATLQDIRRDGLDLVDYDPRTSIPVAGDLRRELFVREPYRVKTQLYSAEVEYNLQWARFNSITSYQRTQKFAISDASPIYVPLLRPAGFDLRSVTLDVPASFNRTAQEFRLTSKSDDKFEWLAGMYFDHETGDNSQVASSTNADGSPGPQLASVLFPSVYNEYSGFGDVTWKFTPKLSVTGGLRVSYNKQSFSQISSGPLVGPARSIRGDSSDNSKTYLLTSRYRLTEDSSVYGRFATAYRAGGPNAVQVDIGSNQPTAPTSFRPDNLLSYEVGYKADLFDKKLTLSSAVYDIFWRDIQQAFVVNGVGVLVNAGKAKIQGAEFSATVRPTEMWTFIGNVSYTNAKFTTDAPGLGARSGSRLPNSARFSGSVAANSNFKVFDYPAYAGVTYRYVGGRDAGIAGSTTLPSYKVPSYSLTDLQAGVDVKQYSVSLFARNIFDKRGQVSASTSLLPVGGNAQVSVAQPRTFGATVSVAF